MALASVLLAADLVERLVQEGLKLGQQRNGILNGQALRWRAPVDPLLDREQFRDALKRLLGQG